MDGCIIISRRMVRGTIDDEKVHISRMFIDNSGATKVSCLGGYFVIIVIPGCIYLRHLWVALSSDDIGIFYDDVMNRKNNSASLLLFKLYEALLFSRTVRLRVVLNNS
jgi:hypothetical protein